MLVYSFVVKPNGPIVFVFGMDGKNNEILISTADGHNLCLVVRIRNIHWNYKLSLSLPLSHLLARM